MNDLKERAVSGVLWTTGLNVFRDLVQFFVMLLLVRLIAPESYGQFGLVTSIMGFLSVFSYRVFLEHTLQVRPGAPVDYQSHFTAGVAIQIALFLVTNLAAEVLKRFATYASVAPVVHVMSILFLLDIGHEFRAKILEREMNWSRLRTLQGIGVVTSTALSLGMAVAGMGVYALIVPSLVAALPTIADLFMIHKWRPTWKWDAIGYGPAWRYGLTRMASALAIWTRQLMESSVLVKIAGFALFGIYGRALGLAAICCLKVPSMLGQSLFPLLTKLDPGSSSSSRASTLVFCSVIWPTFPVAVVFSVLAAPVINTLYGARWSAAIPFVPWAMAAGAATALAQTGSLLLLSNLRQKKSFCIDVIALVGTAFSLLLLAPKGLQNYLIGIASFQTVAFVIMLVWLCQTRSIDLQGITASVILPAVDTGLTYVAMELVRPYLGISRIPGAVSYGLLFSLGYLLLLRFTLARQCREFVRFLPGHTRLMRWLALETDAAEIL